MRIVRSAGVIVLGIVAACSSPTTGFGDDGGDSGSADDAAGTLDSPFTFGDSTTESGPGLCPYNDATDHDGDGFSGVDGDCNDCDPNANPGAFDIPGNNVDEDCSGVPDDEPTKCDANLKIDSTDGFDAAKAMDLCRKTTSNATGKQRTWGVISATYSLPDGTTTTSTNFPLGHGIVSHFGADPQKPANSQPQLGSSMFAISSGTARNPSDPGYQSVSGFSKGFGSAPPQGYTPKTGGCSASNSLFDGMALKLVIRVPTNANSFTLNSVFFTYEWSTFVCTSYNDYFALLMSPKPAKLSDANIVFDQQGDAVSVNNAFLQVCGPPGTYGGKNFTCPQGTSMLTGTGFEGHGATGWLTTTVPVDTLRGQEITLFAAVWDAGDGILDSTAVLDNFQWSVNGATGVTTTPTPH